jgi:hypothetical protein
MSCFRLSTRHSCHGGNYLGKCALDTYREKEFPPGREFSVWSLISAVTVAQRALDRVVANLIPSRDNGGAH